MQIVKIRLDLVEDTPRARALRREQAAPVLETACGPSRDGTEDVQVGQQRLGRGRVGAHGRGRCVVGDAQHEQRVSEYQFARGVGAAHVHVIEPSDVPSTESMRRNRFDEAPTVGGVGARQRHEILHRGVRDEMSILDVLLDRLGKRAHQTHAS